MHCRKVFTEIAVETCCLCNNTGIGSLAIVELTSLNYYIVCLSCTCTDPLCIIILILNPSLTLGLLTCAIWNCALCSFNFFFQYFFQLSLSQIYFHLFTVTYSQ